MVIILNCKPGGMLEQSMEGFDWQGEVHSLAEDTTSGSQAICLKAAEIIIKAVDSIRESQSGDDIRALIKELSRELERAKPAMAGIYTLTAQVMQALETTMGGGQEVASPVRRAAQGFRSRLISSNNLIAGNVIAFLPDRACVVTISRSGTVEAVLKLARERGKLRRVLLSEGRPAYEGRIFATELAEDGIPVVVVADGALPGIVEDCDVIVVGGDALCPSGLVNKAGTFALALAARRVGRPLIACLGTEKIIPFDIPEHFLREDPANLWVDAPLKARVINRIFEFTPLDLIDHIVTEESVTSGEGIPDIFASLEIDPYLPSWL
jgi:translation initiation factor 2B subunit (eIF-2B alpha/beta/delta family)